MEEIKLTIANCINNTLNEKVNVDDIVAKIEVPKNKQNGDFSYPCFNLAKILKNSPINIANSIKDNIVLDDSISRVEVVNGFLNFYLNSQDIVNDVLKKIVEEKEEYGSSKEVKRRLKMQ